MPGIRNAYQTIEVSPRSANTRTTKPTAHVSFASTTSSSRPLASAEHWALWYFEKHAVACKTCHKPDAVQREGGRLCAEGLTLATDVAALLFELRRDGEVYAKSRNAPSKHDDRQEVRIEVPAGYPHTIGLLKAIQRSEQGFLSRAARPRSFDKHHYVAPRVKPAAEGAVPPKPASVTSNSSDGSSNSSGERYNTITVKPLSARGNHLPSSSLKPSSSSSSSRRPSTPPTSLPSSLAPSSSSPTRPTSSSSSSRGSLYDRDRAEQEERERREAYRRYKYEVREPTFSRRR